MGRLHADKSEIKWKDTVSAVAVRLKRRALAKQSGCYGCCGFNKNMNEKQRRQWSVYEQDAILLKTRGGESTEPLCFEIFKCEFVTCGCGSDSCEVADIDEAEVASVNAIDFAAFAAQPASVGTAKVVTTLISKETLDGAIIFFATVARCDKGGG